MHLLPPTHRPLNRPAHPRLVAVGHSIEGGAPSVSEIAKPALTLVRTKTQIPRSYGEIQRRERLDDLCGEVRQRLLTMVMAPPGCGKSTLAQQWAETAVREGGKVAWFSIDATDNDPHRFLMYLHQAVAHSGFSRRGARANGAQVNANGSPSELSSALINWVAEGGEELLVVLDNYAWITNAGIHAQVSYILANAPSNMHVVMLTSDLPPLPIGWLRARNQLLELNSGAIRFTKSEAIALFQKNSLMPLPYRQMEELYRFTNGWAAVVRIISLTIGNLGNLPTLVRGVIDCRIFDAIDQYLDDLFANFPEDLVDMMVDTSIVESLSLPLCLELSNCDNAQTFFSQIRQQQILLPSDPERGTYTYPAPVRRYLHKQLLRKGNRYMAKLHRKAHAWYSENEQWDNAVDHAVAVGDIETAIGWMESHGMSVLKAGSYGTLTKWHRSLSGLNVPLTATIPERVWLSFAWAYAVSDKPDIGLELLAQIAANAPEPLSPVVQAECQAIRAVALVLSDRVDQAVETLALCARQLLTDHWMNIIISGVELYCHLHTGRWTAFYSESSVLDAPSEPEANTHVLRLAILGFAALLRGQLALAERYATEALDLAPTTKAKDFFCFSAWPAGLLAALYYEQNRLDELEAFLPTRLEGIAASGYLDCTLTAFLAAARTAATKGNLAEALAILDRAEGIALARKWSRLEAAVLLERVRLFLDDGRLDEAEGCQQRLSQLSWDTAASDTSPTCSAQHMTQIGHAYLSIHAGRSADVIAPLTDMLNQFLKTGNELFAVRIGTLLSVAYFKCHRTTEAERLFRDTMEKAERGGFVRSVVDQGAETGKLLAALSANLKGKEASARLHNHCERMLKACVGPISSSTEKVSALKQHTGSPLTPKEHDVLALIASGQSNKEIARSLNVAPETIKTHLKNIFFKLSVDRRIQAVAKAQALGLLARDSG